MLEVRTALVKDLDAINKLTFKMHRYLGSLVVIKFTMEELKEEMYENEEDLNNLCIAETDGKVNSYMAFSEEVHENEFFGKYYHLHHLAVEEEFRRKEVATKLLSTLLTKTERERVKVVTDMFCANKDALRFAETNGFKPIETVLILDNLKKLNMPKGS
jgi:ribosomal protein S18 acetylase RimI-like enzyme